jgi:hypothetical protein
VSAAVLLSSLLTTLCCAVLCAVSDVWVSRDLGYTFTRALTRAVWAARISADTQTYYSPVFSKDIIYLADGDIGVPPGPETMSNDVWVSSDNSVSWFPLTTAAPYPGRKDAELTISRDGVLIVSGGDDGESNVNDVRTAPATHRPLSTAASIRCTHSLS